MTTTAALSRLIADAAVSPLPVRRGGRVVGFDGTTVEAIGIDALVGGRVLVGAGRQAAEIIGFRDGRTVLMGLSPLAGITPGAPVLADGINSDVTVGDALLGRVIDGLGRPLDGLGPIAGHERRATHGAALSPADRSRVTQALDTGVRAPSMGC